VDGGGGGELTGKLDADRLAARGNVTRSTTSESSSKQGGSHGRSEAGDRELSVRETRCETGTDHEVDGETSVRFQTDSDDVELMPMSVESTLP